MSIPRCPDDWPYHPWFRLARLRRDVQAEVRASQPGRRAWVSVSPASDPDLPREYGSGIASNASDLQFPPAEEINFYHVLYVEIEADQYERAMAYDDADRFWLNERREIVRGEAELKALLAQWMDDLSDLVAPGVRGLATF